MGGLFSALQNASTALGVFSQALGVDQSNVANASTPGYAAQKATISPIDLSGDGTSVDFVSVSSSGNAFTDATVRAASSQASESQTQAVAAFARSINCSTSPARLVFSRHFSNSALRSRT